MPNVKDWSGVVLGVVAIFAFGWVIVDLSGKVKSATDIEWTRYTYLLTGVEAIAFAAAGFFFGRDVHRSWALAAEKRAADLQASLREALKNVDGLLLLRAGIVSAHDVLNNTGAAAVQTVLHDLEILRNQATALIDAR